MTRLGQGILASIGNTPLMLRVASRLGAAATVVTIACDSGLRYLSTDVFHPEHTD
jgi:cysteine synthase